MKFSSVVKFANTGYQIALVAPNELEKKLLFDSMQIYHAEPANISFLTIDEAISHVTADYYFLIYVDDMPAPLVEQLEYNGNIVRCGGMC